MAEGIARHGIDRSIERDRRQRKTPATIANSPDGLGFYWAPQSLRPRRRVVFYKPKCGTKVHSRAELNEIYQTCNLDMAFRRRLS
jgi:hypothetical protein